MSQLKKGKETGDISIKGKVRINKYDNGGVGSFRARIVLAISETLENRDRSSGSK